MTLGDKVIGLVDPNNDERGTHDELNLVEHVEILAQLGYGYTNMQLK